ncbi:MAG: GerMN domain-containing protein [Ilumatobacteraceae bacterium]
MSRRTSAPVLAIVGLAGVLTLGLAACGIPTGDDTFNGIPSEEVPFGLDSPSTTTSTTTTTTPIAPATTEVRPTTTLVPLEEVDIYFLSRGRLQPVPVGLTTDFAPDQVVDALEHGPPAGVGLDTHIEPGLIVSTEVADGVVTVDLDPEIFARIAASDQAEAIGQIALTMIDNVDRVGSVLFTLAGEPTQVKKGDSLLTEPGEAVTFDDYAVLLTTSAPTTSTTVPAGTVPDPALPDPAAPADPAVTTVPG